MAEVIKIKTEGKYTTHSVKANKNVDITFKMPYTELSSYIQSLQMLNENVTVAVKLGSDKPAKIGTFMIKNVNVDHDGEGTLKLNSQLDYVDSSKINELAARNDEPLFILLKCEVELEEVENEEESA